MSATNERNDFTTKKHVISGTSTRIGGWGVTNEIVRKVWRNALMNNLENQNEPFKRNSLFYRKPMKSFRMRRHVFSRKSSGTIYNSTVGIFCFVLSVENNVHRILVWQKLWIIWRIVFICWRWWTIVDAGAANWQQIAKWCIKVVSRFRFRTPCSWGVCWCKRLACWIGLLKIYIIFPLLIKT